MANYNSFAELAAAMAGANDTTAVITVKTNIQADMVSAGLSSDDQDLVNNELDQINTGNSYRVNYDHLSNGAALFAQFLQYEPSAALYPGQYAVYTALITQAGTAAPTVKVLQNTIGTIVWSRISAGRYKGTLASAFTADKTAVIMATLGNPANGIIGWIYWNNADTVHIETLQLEANVATGVISGTNDDLGVLNDTLVEIRVYA